MLWQTWHLLQIEMMDPLNREGRIQRAAVNTYKYKMERLGKSQIMQTRLRLNEPSVLFVLDRKICCDDKSQDHQPT